jgi:ketosteroid isomerase-like protein
MKKIIYIFSIAVIIITACQTKTEIVPVDTAAAKISVTTILDKYNSAWNSNDVPAMTALLTDDGLFCGTDASELWDKKTLSDGWAQAMSDTSMNYNYTVDKREIRIAADGNSAIALEQFYMKLISPKMPCRIIFHLVKSADNWMIDFISWSLIPKNEDLAKLNIALE